MNWRPSLLALLLLVTLGAEWLRGADTVSAKVRCSPAWVMGDELPDEASGSDGPTDAPDVCLWTSKTPRLGFDLARAYGVLSRQEARGRLCGTGSRLHRRLCVERC